MLSVAANFTGTHLIAGPTATLGVTLSVSDSDPFILAADLVVDWGDGQATVRRITLPYGPVALVHGYSPGTYQVRVGAKNFRSPVPDRAIFQRSVEVEMLGRRETSVPVLVGPILPRVQGYPLTNDWSFNLGGDGAVLESSLTMLMLTKRGERIYDAEYGTTIAQLIFGPNTEELSGLVREEIARATALYEPRAEFIGAGVTRSAATKSMTVLAEFRSRLSGKPVVLNLAFAA